MGDHKGGTAGSGDPVLDAMLRGGYPEDRTTLLVGGPGAGKSTLAMQFLQAGLDAGESCLFVSTEQSPAELVDSFDSYEFDLDHDSLSMATIHAATGSTIEEGSGQLVLTTLADDEDSEGIASIGSYDAPFTTEYVTRALEAYGPCDRVVFDSISGLSVMTDDVDRFRRVVLDLTRFFADELGATALMTAEAGAGLGEDLQFNTHGVVELERRLVADDPHRLVRVKKLRGVDHDRRTFELEFTETGVRVGPARRSQPPALKSHHHTPIGIDGLDELCGGGLATGSGVLLEYDGNAHLRAVLGRLFATAVERDAHLLVVPTIHMRPSGLRTTLESHGHDLDALLEADRLSVVDLTGAWDDARQNVVHADSPSTISTVMASVRDRTDAPIYSMVNTDGLVTTFPAEEVRTLRYRMTATLDPEDVLLNVFTPGVTDDELAAFYRSTAEQVIRTWVADDGLQYVTLRKSPCGFVGTTSLVEYVDEPPYVRVQSPPHEHENPMTR